MAETTPVAIAVALDVSLAMALMDVLQTAVGGVNGVADALERSDRHLFAGCVAFSTGARVLDRAEPVPARTVPAAEYVGALVSLHAGSGAPTSLRRMSGIGSCRRSGS